MIDIYQSILLTHSLKEINMLSINEQVAYLLSEEVLEENMGIISWIKRAYTGKDDESIDHYDEAVARASTKGRLQTVVDDIGQHIGQAHEALTDKWYHDMLKRGAVLDGAVRIFFTTGEGKTKLRKHIEALKKVQAKGEAKLKTIKD